MSEIDAHPVANLGLVAHAYQPETLSMEALNQSGAFPVFGANGIIGRHDNFNHEQPQVVIACRGNTCGAVNRTLPKSWINGNAMVINPYAEKLRKDFLFYVLEIADYSLVITGSAQPQIIRDSLYRLRVPLPPLETQRRIADYLDRETAEIDAAVADLDKYVELLEKRRLETITSAVEGSSGPGKDKLGSGEFFKPKLGYVVIDIRTELNPRKNFELDTPDAENWYVTVRELDGVSIRTSEATSKINDQALEMIQKRARIKVGDVLFSGTGTIGNTALVSLPPSNWGVKEGIYILTPDISLMRSDFLLWILKSRKILSLADEMSDGSTIKSIPIEKLKRVPIPLPSLPVQKLIVNYLDRETTEIDDLITESKKLRGLLLKRRSMLITEVVTGRKQV